MSNNDKLMSKVYDMVNLIILFDKTIDNLCRDLKQQSGCELSQSEIRDSYIQATKKEIGFEND